MNAITSVPAHRPQPYAAAAAATLRQVLAASHAPLRSAVTEYRAATAGLAATVDLLDVLRGAGDIVLAAESIAAAAKQAEAAARAALANALMDTGACSIRSATHTFSASPGRASVVITDAAMVPADMLRQPPPSPDKVKILRLLKANEAVPGCELSNGSQPILTVKAITP